MITKPFFPWCKVRFCGFQEYSLVNNFENVKVKQCKLRNVLS
jgi:hypothetical protein